MEVTIYIPIQDVENNIGPLKKGVIMSLAVCYILIEKGTFVFVFLNTYRWVVVVMLKVVVVVANVM